MIKIILFFILFSVKSAYSECFNKIPVEITEETFNLNLFQPKISNKKYNKQILLDCEFIKKIKKGEEFKDYEIYKYMKGSIIPHGEMKKYRIKIL